MNLNVKQKVISWTGAYNIYDDNGNVIYHAKAEFFSLPKRVVIYDKANNEIAYIEKEILSLFKPAYNILIKNAPIRKIKKEITLIKPKYTLDNMWEFNGDFWRHEYQYNIGRVTKKLLSWADTYSLEIESDKQEEILLALCCLISIEMIKEALKKAVYKKI